MILRCRRVKNIPLVVHAAHAHVLLEMERREIHRDQFEWFDVLFEIDGASQWQIGMGLIDVPLIDSAQGQVSLSDEDITVEYAFSFIVG